MTSGSTNVTGLTVTGVSGHGIDLHSYSDGGIDYHASLGITASAIEGGEVGVDVVGSGGGAALGLRDSTVRDQTEASVRIDGYEDSLFTVRVDVWAVGEVVRASGTTLNGNAYDGQFLRGPLAIGSDLRIASDDAYVQF
ncbi:MAG TPA: hypothetical protein VK698_32295 [Kofleriaceae bacterium]|nr:hypothetical protein [Kofleriaceae bacterium]